MRKDVINIEEGFCPQRALFAYLVGWQRKKVAQVLAPLKFWAQERLATALLDYMEQGHLELPENVLLASLAIYLTSEGENGAPIVAPLRAGEAGHGNDMGANENFVNQ